MWSLPASTVVKPLSAGALAEGAGALALGEGDALPPPEQAASRDRLIARPRARQSTFFICFIPILFLSAFGFSYADDYTASLANIQAFFHITAILCKCKGICMNVRIKWSPCIKAKRDAPNGAVRFVG
jgi:hypothetical protein